MKRVCMLLLGGLISGTVLAADAPMLSVPERYSYAMGVRLGQLLKQQGVAKLDSHAFAAAIDDVLTDRPLRLSAIEMQSAVAEQQALFRQRRAQRAQANLEAGQAFLTRNAGQAGVVVLPSGLQYLVKRSGDGDQVGHDGRVRVHYHGTLLDGSAFDSSVDRGTPAEFALSGVIPGFREALSAMRVGDQWQVFIPPSLGYGERGAGAAIGPNQTLVFELQLLEIIR